MTMLKTGNKRGFTFIEAMLATVILGLGTVLVYEAFFISLNASNYCRDYMEIAPWADEKIWQVQDCLMRLGDAADLDGSGELKAGNKNFKWNMSYYLVDGTQHLYGVDLVLSWQEGPRKAVISRSAYAIHKA
ncbi:MAG: prepilin-type N-terminal cleavage/methylation domain-containing protein [Candidatus Omnitrophica bacterium]|nr:prepilin-type N-terminal cleavage/methylation domain-containing protein [Candidatus Omnitrophota bacterium]